MMYPDDKDFEDALIKEVRESEKGFEIHRNDGWCLFLEKSHGVTPKEGDAIRVYGRGRIRGIFINGVKAFYRTVAEQAELTEHEQYGTVPQDIIDKWDRGDGFWSIEMGGIGPGYEQAIQITAIEILRQMIADKPDTSEWELAPKWSKYSDTISDKLKTKLQPVGLSGAQWGAALNIAGKIYKFGPREFKNSIPDDRKILVSGHWPRISEAK